jgi:hypothetical protein
MTQRRILILAVVSLALASIGSLPAARAADKPLLQVHAFAVDLNAPGARTTSVDIAIERWSTPEEIKRLHDILAEKGGDALLSALQDVKPRVGYIRRGSSLGWDIRFAKEDVSSDGTRRVIIATDRPMSFWEAANRPRSADYAFTLAELHIRPDGTGEGKLVPAAMIAFNAESNTLQIENYQTQPVRLAEVRVEK